MKLAIKRIHFYFCASIAIFVLGMIYYYEHYYYNPQALEDIPIPDYTRMEYNDLYIRFSKGVSDNLSHVIINDKEIQQFIFKSLKESVFVGRHTYDHTAYSLKYFDENHNAQQLKLWTDVSDIYVLKDNTLLGSDNFTEIINAIRDSVGVAGNTPITIVSPIVIDKGIGDDILFTFKYNNQIISIKTGISLRKYGD